jgi:hypothetical protein
MTLFMIPSSTPHPINPVRAESGKSTVYLLGSCTSNNGYLFVDQETPIFFSLILDSGTGTNRLSVSSHISLIYFALLLAMLSRETFHRWTDSLETDL